ncbi:MAG: hypothetical protein RJQ05_13245 [Cytophagales bacterium]|jgi:hypothetical protein
MSLILHHKLINLLSKVELGDWISILSLIVNSGLAIWLVLTLQNKLANQRVLKDHLINEIKDLRDQYKSFINDLRSGKIKPKDVNSRLKLMNITAHDLIDLSKKKAGCKKDFLNSYQVELRDIVTEFPEYKSSFKANIEFELDSESVTQLLKFQQQNQHLFNDLILIVNQN